MRLYIERSRPEVGASVYMFSFVYLMLGLFFLLNTSSVFAFFLTGDANNDCRVDGLDYVIWLNNYGTVTDKGAEKGDFNTPPDGKVDGVDYVAWLNNYGRVCPSSTPTHTPTPTSTESPLNVMTVKTLAINFNPEKGDRDLATTYYNHLLRGMTPDEYIDKWFNWNIGNIKEFSNNDIKYEIIGKMTISGFPRYKNNFQFTVDEFKQCTNGGKLSNGLTCEQQKWHFDDVAWIKSNKICEKAEELGAEEIWVMANPFIMTWENFMVGPEAGFGVNGPAYAVSNCKKYHVIMNMTFEVAGNLLHTYGHRIEDTMRYLTRNWTSQDTQKYWERFAIMSRYTSAPPVNEGCGNAHYPLNTTKSYDYRNTGNKVFNCPDWKNFPDFTGETETINCQAWNCSDVGWQQHWFGSLPRRTGQATMVSRNNKRFTFKKNWWYYILYPINAINFNRQF